VKSASTTSVISDTPSPSNIGQNVTIAYSVTGSGTPTGNVTATDGVNSCTASVAAGSCVLAGDVCRELDALATEGRGGRRLDRCTEQVGICVFAGAQHSARLAAERRIPARPQHVARGP